MTQVAHLVTITLATVLEANLRLLLQAPTNTHILTAVGLTIGLHPLCFGLRGVVADELTAPCNRGCFPGPLSHLVQVREGFPQVVSHLHPIHGGKRYADCLCYLLLGVVGEQSDDGLYLVLREGFSLHSELNQTEQTAPVIKRMIAAPSKSQTGACALIAQTSAQFHRTRAPQVASRHRMIESACFISVRV